MGLPFRCLVLAILAATGLSLLMPRRCDSEALILSPQSMGIGSISCASWIHMATASTISTPPDVGVILSNLHPVCSSNLMYSSSVLCLPPK